MERQGDGPAPPSGNPGPSSMSPCPPVTHWVKEALIHAWGKINCYFIILINWYTAICFHYSTHIAGKIIPSFSTSLHCCFTKTFLLEAFGGFFIRIVEPLCFWTWLSDSTFGLSTVNSGEHRHLLKDLLTKRTAQCPTSLSCWVQFV